MSDSLFILRYGEIFLKGGNRPFFERRLLDGVRRVMAPLGGRVERLHGRVAVHVDADREAEAVLRLGCVFGLTSYSPATAVEPELGALCAAAAAAAQRAVECWAGDGPRTFKVETRRADKSFPMKSPEISRQVGSAVFEVLGLPVDLRDPELRVEVEIGAQRTFVTTTRHPGLGGLPVGSSGQVQLLLSGGIDSPVAGFLLLKRGCTLAPVTFESPPYTGEDAREKVIDLCTRLARFGGPMRLRIVRFTEAQLAIHRLCPGRLAVVLYRRMMVRAAEKAAALDRCLALATGESIGQVASQTLENMACIAEASSLPILRPLLTYDKAETIELARRVGTYDISIRPHVDCCSLFVPDHPETRAALDPVLEAEQRLGDVDATAQQLIDSSEVVEIEDPLQPGGNRKSEIREPSRSLGHRPI
ncbi:MAG: tRNA uracil 4-sulfurtransferase ThiI [bacterium]